MNPKCHGFLPQTNQPLHLETPVVRKPVGYCKPTNKISQKLSYLLKSLQTHQLGSPLHSGNESSKVSQSTSTKYSHHSTMLSLMKREWVAWETQKSLSESLKKRKEFQLLQNGLLLGGKYQRQSPLPFHTGERNSSTMEITSKLNLLPNNLPSTIKSSSMMLPSETKLQQHNKSSLLTRLGSLDSIPPLSCLMELNHIQTSQTTKDPISVNHRANQKSAINSMLVPARTPTQDASINMPVKIATKLDTEAKTASKRPNEVFGLQPKYLHHNL